MKGFVVTLLMLLFINNVYSQDKLNVDLFKNKTLVTETDSFVLKDQTPSTFGEESEYIIEQYSMLNDTPAIIKDLSFGDYKLINELIYSNGKPFTINVYSWKDYNLLISGELILDTVVVRKYESMEKYKLNGAVKFYKNGRLNIIAIYVKGKFSHVLYYKNKRQLKRFLKRDNLNDWVPFARTVDSHYPIL